MNLRSLLPFVIPLIIGCSGSAPIIPSESASTRVQGATDLGRLGGDALHQYSDGDGTFFAASGPLAIANELIGTVNGVVGLSGTGYWKSHLVWPNLSPGAALAPADMEKIYGSAAIANPGMGETVAI